MTFMDVVVTFLVLGSLFVLGYCRMTNQTLVELLKEIREFFQDKQEVIIPNEQVF